MERENSIKKSSTNREPLEKASDLNSRYIVTNTFVGTKSLAELLTNLAVRKARSSAMKENAG